MKLTCFYGDRKMVSKLSWHRNVRLSDDAPKMFVKNFSLNDVLESAGIFDYSVAKNRS